MKKTFCIGLSMLILMTCVCTIVGCSRKSLIDKNIELLESYAEKCEKAYKANDMDKLLESFEPMQETMTLLQEHHDEMTKEQMERVLKVVDRMNKLQ